ncbi:MAG: lamin tail domain-containing protein [Verrucomicrobia bacterium]|nr:lamin tail domain-containing protein [Verrucomicrobiota bacterium]
MNKLKRYYSWNGIKVILFLFGLVFFMLPGICRAQSEAPADIGAYVNGFQDDFERDGVGTNWVNAAGGQDIFTVSEGILSVSSAAGDPNHLLLAGEDYDDRVQEVLARIRILDFGAGDPPRGGIGVSVDENTSQGINYHFRDYQGRHTQFLDDLRDWGVSDNYVWENDTWYWMRLQRRAASADGAEVRAKIWRADGSAPEPESWLEWTGYSPDRSGLAGITAGSSGGVSEFEVDYILIKAGGLPEIRVTSEAFPAYNEGPVSITEHPASITKLEGETAEFNVEVDGTPPYSFQWNINGNPVEGATNSRFRISNVLPSDDGTRISVAVDNSLGSAVSDEAVLTIVPDETPPRITDIYAAGTNSVVIEFSEPVRPEDAVDMGNYAIAPGIEVLSAQIDDAGIRVILNTSELVFGEVYTLYVTGIRDLSVAGNTIVEGDGIEFVPAEFIDVAVGEPAGEGGMVTVGDGYDITGYGSGTSGKSDQFQFSYREKSGDFDVNVRVASITGGESWAKAGLMARGGLDDGGRFAGVFAPMRIGGCVFQYRLEPGTAASAVGNLQVNYPYTWLRLRREGNKFFGYAGFDGKHWLRLGSVTVDMPEKVYLGMSVSSGDDTSPAVAAFRGFGAVSDAAPFVYPAHREPMGPSSRRTGWVISEVMYAPVSEAGETAVEFVEVYNSEPVTVDLGGYRVEGDIEFEFPAGTRVDAGGYLVIASDTQAPAQWDSEVSVAGAFTGRLPDDEGTLRLVNRVGAILLEVEYTSRQPWPVGAAGLGHSLVLTAPSYGEADSRAWSASSLKGGSPGAPNPIVMNSYSGMVINEVLARPAQGADAFIELYNHSTDDVDLSGCWLKSCETGAEYRVPEGTSIAAGGFLTMTTDELGFVPALTGDVVALTTPEKELLIDAVFAGAQLVNAPMGRYRDGDERFRLLSEPTPGAANSGAYEFPVVISELMYHPISDDVDDEYIELFNRGSNAVDMSGWRFTDGIDFTFPEDAIIPAGGYVVAAENAGRLVKRYSQLNESNTFGNYGGRLSNSGERVALCRPETMTLINPDSVVSTITAYVLVDEVEYVDGGAWGKWSDGGGSRLELIDTRVDNSVAANWADSDESSKSAWTVIEHTGTLDHGRDAINAVQLLAQGAGEYLIDDIEVLPESGGNVVSNPSFEQGLSGWSMIGTHAGSRLEDGQGYEGENSLHIRAVARGDTGANRVQAALTQTLSPGAKATIRAKVRWLKGHPEFLVRLYGNYLEAFGWLNLPENLGSPGLPNSRAMSNAGPAILNTQHYPVLPAGGEDVVVTAGLADIDGIGSVMLKYIIDSTGAENEVSMNDQGVDGDSVASDGIYSAVIPGMQAGALVRFYIEASDSATQPAMSRFPENAPTSNCLIRFGETQPFGEFGTYRMWIDSDTFNEWLRRSKMDNTPLGITFVYGNSRAVYGSAALYAGSPHISPGYNTPVGNLCGYVVHFPKDEKFLGASEIVLDWPSRDDSKVQEQSVYWMAEEMELPNLHRRFIHLHVNGVTAQQRGGVYEDAQQVNSDYIESWLPDGQDGDLHKIEQWFEFGPGGGRTVLVPPTLEKFITDNGEFKTARYRWNWLKRAVRGSANDFENLFDLAIAANAPQENGVYEDLLTAQADVEQWMRIFALEHIIGNFDSYGHFIGKNMYAYKPPGGKWSMHMWDIDWLMNASIALGVTPTSPLFECEDPVISRIYEYPAFRRAYFRAVKDAVYGPLRPDAVGPWLDAKNAALLRNGINAASTDAGKNWLSQRRDYLLQQLAGVEADFAVTTPAQSQVVFSNNFIELAGTAPVDVKTIRVNGATVPLTWRSVNEWRFEITLAGGTNTFVIEGFDRSSEPVPGASEQVNIIYNDSPANPASYLVINEIMYHPQQDDAEFLEIYNMSEKDAFDLSGFRVNGLDYTFGGSSIIRPGEYLVLAEDRAAFARTYGDTILVAGEYNGSLDNGGETLSLLSSAGQVNGHEEIIDQVRYDDDPPWPVVADGLGPSLELIDPTRDNRRAGNWSAFREVTTNFSLPMISMDHVWKYNQSGSAETNWMQPGYDDSLWQEGSALLYVEDAQLAYPKNTPLELGQITYYFRSVFTNDYSADIPVDIRLSTVIDDGAIIYINGEEVFRLGMDPGDVDSSTMSSRGVGDAALEGLFEVSGSALRQGLNTIAVEVHQTSDGSSDIVMGLELKLESRRQGSCSPGMKNHAFNSLPEFPDIWINEVMPVPDTQAENGALNAAPWIEIYNASGSAVDLGGFFLSGNLTNPIEWAFPEGTVVDAGGFLVVSLSADAAGMAQDVVKGDVTFSPGAGIVLLSMTAGNKTVIVDSLAYSDLRDGRSIGRFPDGDYMNIRPFDVVSPNQANIGTAYLPPVKINEWMADNSLTISDPSDGRYDDWFELFNTGDATVDLSGFTLTDDLDNTNNWAIPPGTVMGPKGFLLVWADGDPDQNSVTNTHIHAGFRLDKDGEEIGLFAPDGRLVDSVVFPAQREDVSQGRWPDGAVGDYKWMPIPTPGEANILQNAGVHGLTAVIDETGTNLIISWDAVDGVDYIIESKASLMDDTWIQQEFVRGTNGHAEVVVPIGAGRKFFRVKTGE